MVHWILSNIRGADVFGNKVKHCLKETQVTIYLLKVFIS